MSFDFFLNSTPVLVLMLYFISIPKQPGCEKRVQPQKARVKKRCGIQGGNQDTTVMVGK